MCGIYGLVSSRKIEETQLKKMGLSLERRGPDAEGIFIDKINDSIHIGLGQRRLKIIDLSDSANQPMFDGKDLVIVFNGEIYNFKEIRKNLSKKGYIFKTNSDTEVILKSYREWGIDAINKFIGMFAISIYDKRKGKLYLIRDRVGIKPLFYYYTGNEFVFASTTAAIKAYKSDLKISQIALKDFFQYGYIASNLSIYENCYRLNPGHYLELDIEKLEFKIKKYWDVLDFYKTPKFQWNEKKILNALEELLVDAVKYRMVSDVPVGVFLSGGTDSSIVSAILQKHYGKIHTFTIGFKEKKYDESKYAEEVAKHIGSEHTTRILSINAAKELINNFVDIYDEPFGDTSGIPTTLVSRIAKENGMKVVLSADGGDELFGGYNIYFKTFKTGNILFKSPLLIKKIFYVLLKLGKPFSNSRKISYKYNLLLNLMKQNTWGDLYDYIISIYRNFELEEVFDTLNYNRETINFGEYEHPIQAMMLWDFKHYLVDDILVKVDRATMYNSIEGRVPLLDHRIAEFLARVPFDLKYKNRESKYLLKKILEKYIPKELIYRPKQGFAVPLDDWFKKDPNTLYKILLKKSKCEMIDKNFIKSEINKYKNGYIKNSRKIWLILIAEMWHEKYMDI